MTASAGGGRKVGRLTSWEDRMRRHGRGLTLVSKKLTQVLAGPPFARKADARAHGVTLALAGGRYGCCFIRSASAAM